MSLESFNHVELRAAVESVLNKWFEMRVDTQRAHYAEGKGPRKVHAHIPEERWYELDPLSQARQDRPELWNTHFKREVHYTDHNGNIATRTERISILDAFGPGPAETRQRAGSRIPDFSKLSMDTEEPQSRAVSQEERDRIRNRLDWFRRINGAMNRLQQWYPEGYLVLELYLAHYTKAQIATKLRIKKNQVEKVHESALVWVMGVVFTNPIWREHLDEFRTVLKEHHHLRKMRKIEEGDLFPIAEKPPEPLIATG